jgi:hypothetical protein
MMRDYNKKLKTDEDEKEAKEVKEVKETKVKVSDAA